MTNLLLAWIAVWTFGTWAELKKPHLPPRPSYWIPLLDLILAVFILLAIIETVRPNLLPA